MNTLLKSMLMATTPALFASVALAADNPATQPQAAAQPTTQPAAPLIAQSNEALIIPDGTSPQNPGPNALPNLQGQGVILMGPNGPYRIINIAGSRE